MKVLRRASTVGSKLEMAPQRVIRILDEAEFIRRLSESAQV